MGNKLTFTRLFQPGNVLRTVKDLQVRPAFDKSGQVKSPLEIFSNPLSPLRLLEQNTTVLVLEVGHFITDYSGLRYDWWAGGKSPPPMDRLRKKRAVSVLKLFCEDKIYYMFGPKANRKQFDLVSTTIQK